MTTKARVVFGSAFVVLGLCLTAAVTFTQPKLAKDDTTIESIAGTAMQQIFNTSYKGNGRRLSGAGVSTWLSQNRVNISRFKPDIVSEIRRGSVEGLVIPDVTNPSTPGSKGEVVLVRSTCQLTTTGCSRRAILIQPPSFFGSRGDDELCENCRGCEGTQPPNCDIQRICTCTNGRCPGSSCQPCSGC